MAHTPAHTNPWQYHQRPHRLTNTSRLFSYPPSNNHTLMPLSARTDCHRCFYSSTLSPAKTYTLTPHLCTPHLCTHGSAQTHKYTLTHDINQPPLLVHTPPHTHTLIPTHLHAHSSLHTPPAGTNTPPLPVCAFTLTLLAPALLGYRHLSLPVQGPWEDSGPLTLGQSITPCPCPDSRH